MLGWAAKLIFKRRAHEGVPLSRYLKLSSEILQRAAATEVEAKKIANDSEAAADRGLSQLVSLMTNGRTAP